MKNLVSTLLQRSTLMVTSFILAISSLSAAMPLFLSQTANAVAAYAITSTTTPAVTYTDIQTAVDATAPGDTIEIGAGTYNLLSQLNINKPLSIIGTSSVIVKSNNAAWSTVNGSKHLVSITAGTSVNPVSISNITFDANGQSYGMNTYSNAYGVLNNVTIMNSKGAGLTVNGSTIEATNLDTSGNSWGAVNVDPGSGVTTPSVFTLNSGNLTETKQIWSDGNNVTAGATVTVNAAGYTLYHASSFIEWATTSPAPVIGVTAPVDGDVVYKSNGNYTISADVTDPNGDLNIVEWSLTGPTNEHSVPATFKQQPGDKWSGTYNLAAIPTGDYTLTFTATDDNGYSATPKVVNVTLADKPLEITKVDPYFRAYTSKPGVTHIIGVDTTIGGYHSDVASLKVQLLKGGIVLSENIATASLIGNIKADGSTTVNRSSPFYLPVNTPSTSNWIHDGYMFSKTSEPDQVRVIVTDGSGGGDTEIVNLSASNLSYGGESYQDVVPASIRPVVDSITVGGQDITRTNYSATHPYISGSTQRVGINIAASNPVVMTGGYLMLNKLPVAGSPSNGTRTNYPIQHDSNGWYAMVNTKNLQGDGKYLFKVEAHGNSAPWGYFGNTSAWNSHSYYVNVDNTIPAMQDIKLFVKNSSGNYVASSYVKAGDQAMVEVRATDQASGIKNVEFRIQDASTGAYVAPRDFVVTTVSADTYQYDFTVPADGKYTNTHGPITTSTNGLKFWARAYDNVGNYGNGTSTNGLSGNFTYDNTKPSVSITTPTNGQILNGTFDAEGVASDAQSSISKVDYTVTKISALGGSYVSNVTSGTANGTSSWNFNVSGLTDGFYRVKVQAFDQAGNHKYSYHDVQVDNTKPSVSITTPTNGQILNGTFDAEGVASDAQSSISKVDYTVTKISALGGSYVSNVTSGTANGTSSWNFNVSGLTDGFYRVKVQAFDQAGNHKYSYHDVQVDNTAPVVNITAPTAGNYGFINTVNINADIDDAVSYRLLVNGSEVATGGSTFVPYALPVVDGIYDIQVEAIDAAGNIGTSAVTTINVDDTAPILTVIGYNGTSLTPPITGTTDSATDVVTVDGAVATVNPVANGFGTFDWTFTLPTQTVGSHTITVISTDTFGNATTETANVTVNSIPATQTTPATITTTVTPTGATTDNTGDQEVLGDQTTNNDAAKTGDSNANPSASILGDATSNPMNLFGLAWYWWLGILAAIIAAWWIIAAALRRRDNENA